MNKVFKKLQLKIKLLINKIKRVDLAVKHYQTTALSVVMPSYAYINWGKQLAKQGNLLEAIKKFETSAFMAQQIPEAYINLGLVYANLRDFQKAAKNFKRAIRLDRNNAKAYSLLASILMEQKEVKEAQYLYKKANKLAPNDSEIYVNWAISLLQLNRKQEAFEKFKLAVLYNPTNYIATHMWGVALFENRQYDAAIKQFEYTLSFTPHNPETLYYLAICLKEKGQMQEALENAKKSLLIESDNVQTYLLISDIYMKLKDEQNCLKYCEEARKRGFKSPKFFLFYGCALYSFKHDEEAKEKFLEVLALEPDNISALFHLAQCEFTLSDIEVAYELFKRVIEFDPKHTQALNYIGDYYFKHQMYDEAIEIYRKILSISVKSVNYIYFKLANCYAAKGDYNLAVKFHNKNIEYYPDFVASYTCIVTLYLQAGNFIEAQRKIRAAYKIQPDNILVNFLYGQVFYFSKIYKEVIDKLEFVLTKIPEETAAFNMLVISYISTNNVDRAMELLDSVEDKNNVNIQALYADLYLKLAYLEPSYYNERKAREFLLEFQEKYPDYNAEKDIKIANVTNLGVNKKEIK